MSVYSIEVHTTALRYVVDYVTRNGYPPTVRDIGIAVGYSSPSTAAKVVEGLRGRGWLQAVPGKARTMRVTDEGLVAIGAARG